MESNKTFENLNVWKEAMNLCLNTYKTVENCPDSDLKRQLRQTSIDIPANIAEGFERNKNLEMAQFLYAAKGCCGRLRSNLLLAKNLGHISHEVADPLINHAADISKMLVNVLQHQKNNVN